MIFGDKLEDYKRFIKFNLNKVNESENINLTPEQRERNGSLIEEK
jgi:hypothetical protein